MAVALKPDRRIERTRKALLSAFRDLMFERGYARLTVRDVIDRADVGRSTFYEHFESKDDLLRQSMADLLAVLAATVAAGDPNQALRAVIAHIGENRGFARALLSGASRRFISHCLAEMIEERLAARARVAPGGAPLLALPLVAAHLAEGQLGLLEAWLSGANPSAPEALARGLRASAQATVAALLGC